jgi:hypothetical protein
MSRAGSPKSTRAMSWSFPYGTTVGARGEVDGVGEPGPVHADHGVEGVDLTRERVVARPRAAGDRDVEPGRLSGGDDLREVEEPPAVGPLQDHHPGGGGAGSTPASETR